MDAFARRFDSPPRNRLAALRKKIKNETHSCKPPATTEDEEREKLHFLKMVKERRP